MIVAVITFFVVGAATLQRSRLLAGVPARFFAVAEAAGLVPMTPWTPRKDGELAQFESERVEPALAAALPLDARDVAREVIGQRSAMPPRVARRVADAVFDEAQRVGVDPLLVLAVIDVESKYDPEAESYRGARGLMQLMPETRQWLIDITPELIDELDSDDTRDPVSNVRIGVRYLAHLGRGFRSMTHVLQAYNCGPSRLGAILRGESVLPEESKFYAERVQRIYARLRREYPQAAR